MEFRSNNIISGYEGSKPRKIIITPERWAELKMVKEPLKTSGSALLDDLIRKLLVKNPDNRITWEQYFEHPFFQ